MDNFVNRKPFVAGQFYEKNPFLLAKQVDKFIVKDTNKVNATAVISPHAGFIYSGSVAGAVYSNINIPNTFILIGPNHTGLGSPLSVFSKGIWETPLHNFEVDESITSSLLSSCNHFISDVNAHIYEHSIEVQLPFIAFFSKEVKIAPICVMRASLSQCKEIGEAIARVIKTQKKKIVLVASSDMSHYVDEETARDLDNYAIREILKINPEGLYNVVSQKYISMCGVLPVIITLYAALSLGAINSTLIKYTTSAEVSGDYKHVVGYAGILIN